MAYSVRPSGFNVKINSLQFESIPIFAEQTINQTKSIIDEYVEGKINGIDMNLVDINDIKQNFASIFSSANNYKVGDYVLYTHNNQTKLYKFIKPHVANTQWDPTEIQIIQMGSEISDLIKITNELPQISSNTKIWIDQNSNIEYLIPTWEEFSKVYKAGRQDANNIFTSNKYVMSKSISVNVNASTFSIDSYTKGENNLYAYAPRDKNRGVTDWIKVKPNTKYLVYKRRLFKNNKLLPQKFIRVITCENCNTNKFITTAITTNTFTTPNNAYYIRLLFTEDDFKNKIIILENPNINSESISDLDDTDHYAAEYFTKDGLIDVTKIGVDNTGEIDCTDLLQTIIDFLPYMNCRGLYFPVGYYTISKTLKVSKFLMPPFLKDNEYNALSEAKKKEYLKYKIKWYNKKIQVLQSRASEILPLDNIDKLLNLNATYNEIDTTDDFENTQNTLSSQMSEIDNFNSTLLESIIFRGESILPDKYSRLVQPNHRYKGSVLKFTANGAAYSQTDGKYVPQVASAIQAYDQVNMIVENLTFDGDYDAFNKTGLHKVHIKIIRGETHAQYPLHTIEYVDNTLAILKQLYPNDEVINNQTSLETQTVGIDNYKNHGSSPKTVNGYDLYNISDYHQNNNARIEIRNCIFHGFTQAAIRMGSALTQVKDCVFQYCNEAIRSLQSVDSLIDTPYIQWCRRGIVGDGAFTRITNPRIEEIEQLGIKMSGGGTVITGGYIDRTGYACINISNTGGFLNHCIVSGISIGRGGGYYGDLTLSEILAKYEGNDFETEISKACNLYLVNVKESSISYVSRSTNIHDNSPNSAVIPSLNAVVRHCHNVNLYMNGNATRNLRNNLRHNMYSNDNDNVTVYSNQDICCYNNNTKMSIMPFIIDSMLNLYSDTTQKLQFLEKCNLNTTVTLKLDIKIDYSTGNEGPLDDSLIGKVQCSNFIRINEGYINKYLKLTMDNLDSIFYNLRCYDDNYIYIGTASPAQIDNIAPRRLNNTAYVRLYLQAGAAASNALLPLVNDKYYNKIINFNYYENQNDVAPILVEKYWITQYVE